MKGAINLFLAQTVTIGRPRSAMLVTRAPGQMNGRKIARMMTNEDLSDGLSHVLTCGSRGHRGAGAARRSSSSAGRACKVEVRLIALVGQSS